MRVYFRVYCVMVQDDGTRIYQVRQINDYHDGTTRKFWDDELFTDRNKAEERRQFLEDEWEANEEDWKEVYGDEGSLFF